MEFLLCPSTTEAAFSLQCSVIVVVPGILISSLSLLMFYIQHMENDTLCCQIKVHFKFPPTKWKKFLLMESTTEFKEWVICIHIYVDHHQTGIGKCLLLCQEDVLGQVFPTAGKLSGEIRERGGSRIEIMCGLEIAAMEIELKYLQTQVLSLCLRGIK